MSATIGPRFALTVTAPTEWNVAGALSDNEIAVRTANGEGLILEMHSPALRERLRSSPLTPLTVFVAQVLREDAELYFAFETPHERRLFVELREIDSFGPQKAALALSALGPRNLAAMLGGQVPAGLKVTGLGPKSLEKLASGLKSAREKFSVLLLSAGVAAPVAASPESEGLPSSLVAALEKLGLRPADTQRVYAELAQDTPGFARLNSSEIIRLILQRWGLSRSRPLQTAGEAAL